MLGLGRGARDTRLDQQAPEAQSGRQPDEPAGADEGADGSSGGAVGGSRERAHVETVTERVARDKALTDALETLRALAELLRQASFRYLPRATPLCACGPPCIRLSSCAHWLLRSEKP